MRFGIQTTRVARRSLHQSAAWGGLLSTRVACAAPLRRHDLGGHEDRTCREERARRRCARTSGHRPFLPLLGGCICVPREHRTSTPACTQWGL